jgi:hypothetical protein
MFHSSLEDGGARSGGRTRGTGRIEPPGAIATNRDGRRVAPSERNSLMLPELEKG